MKFRWTQAVKVRRNINEAKDPFNHQAEPTWEEETVENCVVTPTNGTEIIESNGPDGFKVTATLHLPKTYTKSLQGAQVQFQGVWLDVAGDNFAYPENCPTEWNRNVLLGVING